MVPIRYTTDAYFDLELTESESAFSARMVKKQFETPVTHTPEEYDFPDKLYQDYWEKAEAYGIVGADGRCWPASNSALRSGVTGSWSRSFGFRISCTERELEPA